MAAFVLPVPPEILLIEENIERLQKLTSLRTQAPDDPPTCYACGQTHAANLAEEASCMATEIYRLRCAIVEHQTRIREQAIELDEWRAGTRPEQSEWRAFLALRQSVKKLPASFNEKLKRSGKGSHG